MRERSVAMAHQRCQDLAWKSAPRKLSLHHKEVHIWKINLPISGKAQDFLKKNLSCDELLRVNRFCFNTDKERSIISRGALRDILARYLNCVPKDICFGYNVFGKPYLEGGGLYFNLSHSGRCIVFAMTKNSHIGIDIEKFRYDFDCLSIARRFFSQNEYQKLLGISGDDRHINFYRFWTRKEALVKALGVGLSFPLKELDDCLSPVKIQCVQTFNEIHGQCLWYLQEIHPQKNYIVAVVTAQKHSKIRLWNWG